MIAQEPADAIFAKKRLVAHNICCYNKGNFDEERSNLIGRTSNGKLIHVAYTLRGEVVRIISARKATKTEGKLYDQQC
jgi:uncharacterized DUF497 family protein